MSKQTLEQGGRKWITFFFFPSLFVFVAPFYKELKTKWRENKRYN